MSTAGPKDRAADDDTHLDRVAQLLDEYLRGRHAGEPVDLERLLREEVPGVVGAVREQIDVLESLDATYDDEDGLLDTGRTLGDYRLLREIGRGGMGVVYEAEQISLGRRVALKVLPLVGLLDSRQAERFRNEARAAAQLRHNNIVPVFAVGCERGVHYYAMQFIEGRSLHDILGELRASGDRLVDATSLLRSRTALTHAGQATPGGSPSPTGAPADSDSALDSSAAKGTVSTLAYQRAVVRLTLEAAMALDHAHQVGIVHRDVKPANLLVDTEGHLWVTDFGLAQSSESEGLTLTGELVGTLKYMSPEQTEGQGALVDQRTDIYSLGVTLYELLTLELPFRSSGRADVIERIRNETPRRPRALEPRLSRDYETVILKAIDKEPDVRYRTMGDFASDLAALLEDRPIRARPLGTAARLRRWCRRNRTVTALCALAVVLLLGMLTTLAVNRSITRSETLALVFQALSRSRALRLESGPGRKAGAMELLEDVAGRLRELDVDPGIRGEPVLQLRNELVAWASQYTARVGETWELGTPNTAFALSPDFEHYAVACESGRVDVYHIESGRIKARLGGGQGRDDTSVSFSPTGRFLQVYDLVSSVPGPGGFGNFALTVWDWRTESVVLEPGGDLVHGSDFGPEENLFTLKVEGEETWIVRHDLDAGEVVGRSPAPAGVYALVVHPHGTHVALRGVSEYHVVAAPGASPEGGGGESAARRIGSGWPGRAYLTKLAWSPDGGRLALGTANGEIHVVDATTGQWIYTGSGHQSSLRNVRFNHRGDLLAGSSWDGTTRLFDGHIGEELLVLDGECWTSLQFRADDRRLGCAKLRGRRARFTWLVEPPRIRRSVFFRSAHGKDGSTDVGLSTDGRLAATGHVQDGLRLWDLRRGTLLAERGLDAVNSVWFDTSRDSLVTLGRRGAHTWPLVRTTETRWRLGPPRHMTFLPSTENPYYAADFTHRFFVARARTHVIGADRRTGVQRRFPHAYFGFAVSSTGLVALTEMGNEDQGRVCVADIPSGRVLVQFDYSAHARPRFSPDGKWLVVSAVPDTRVFDAERLRAKAETASPAPPQAVVRIASPYSRGRRNRTRFSRDGRLLVLADHRQARLYVVGSWEHLLTVESPDSGHIRTVAFTPDNRTLVMATSNNSIHLWKLDEAAAILDEHHVGIGWTPGGGRVGDHAERTTDEPLELEILLGFENDFPLHDPFTPELKAQYDEAIRQTPDDPELYRQRALWHKHNGNADAAGEDLERAAERDAEVLPRK